MDPNCRKKILGFDVKIEYKADENTDVFDFYEEDDPFKEIITS